MCILDALLGDDVVVMISLICQPDIAANNVYSLLLRVYILFSPAFLSHFNNYAYDVRSTRCQTKAPTIFKTKAATV